MAGQIYSKGTSMLVIKNFKYNGQAPAGVLYGSGTGPTEPLFKKLKDIWDSLDKQSYSSIEVPRSQRKLLLLVEQVVTFLQD